MRDVPQRPYTDYERETITKMIADGHSSREVAERLGRTRNSVIAINNREKLGIWKFSNGRTADRVQWTPATVTPRARIRPVLDTEVDIIRRLIAEGKSAAEVAAVVDRTIRAVKSIVSYRSLGPFTKRSASSRNTSRDRAVPDGFAALWAVKTQTQLREHYRVGKQTITEWVRMAGLTRTRAEWVPVTRRETTPSIATSTRTVSRIPGNRLAPFGNIYRDPTRAGQAADVLRKDGWKVHRCNAAGIYDPAGSLWQCGRVRVTEAELIERADRVLARKMAA